MRSSRSSLGSSSSLTPLACVKVCERPGWGASRAVLVACLLLVLLPVRAWSAFVVDSAAVAPTSAVAGVASPVTVTALITEPSVLPEGVNLQRLDSTGRVLAVLGILHDDGLGGDAVAGDRTFTLRVTLFEQSPGPITLRVSAPFRGRILRATSSPLTVSITAAATGIAILSPANPAFVNSSPITVAGTVVDPGAAVTVNGIPVVVSGGQFQTSVPLLEGTNTVTAVALNTDGTKNTASVQVTLDTTPPRLTIDSPAEGTSTTDSSITVAGTVSDFLEAQVSVNGVPAQIANRQFVAIVPLALGANTIQAIARDRSGNSTIAVVHVTRVPPPSPFIRVISGNNQSGPTFSVLPAPLVVALDNGNGQPVANTIVVFKVTENNGLVTAGGSIGASVAVSSDASGRAQVTFQLGSRAGAGANRVEASATGFAGTAVFTATGIPAGAALIVVDSGNNQTGAIGTALASPFVVVVTDAGFNRLGGVPVTFTVTLGGGSLSSGGALGALTVNTDPNGVAAVFLTLGPNPGLSNNVVEANFPGNIGTSATFVASATAPGNAP